MIIMTMMTMKTMNMMTVIKSPTLMNMTLKIKNTSERRTRRILEWNTLGKQRWQDIASGTALAWIVNAVAYGHWMRLKMKLYFSHCTMNDRKKSFILLACLFDFDFDLNDILQWTHR